MKGQKALFSSASCEWYTPNWLFKELDDEFHFDLDVCATPENAKCARFFTKDQDGLQQKWTGVCWMIPPYGKGLDLWLKKAYESSLNGATVVCLLPARTCRDWFHDYALKGEVRFIRGRLKFGGSKDNAPFSSIDVVFREVKDE